MSIFWSAQKKGFYSDVIHGELPDDCRKISDEQYADLINGLAEGRTIVSGITGFPELGDHEAPSVEQLAEAARNKRDALLRDYYDVGVTMIQRNIRMAKPEDVEPLKEALAALDKYAYDLQNVPQQPGFPENIQWPEQPSNEQ